MGCSTSSRQTITTTHKKARSFEPLRDLIGDGLLLSDGDFWRKQRRLMQPVFHRQKIQVFADMIGEETAGALDSWGQAAASGQPLNIQQEMMRFTLSIITRALFNERIGDENGSIGKNLHHPARRQHLPLRLPLLPVPQLPIPRNRRYQQAKAELIAVIDGLIERRKASIGEYGDLLDLLMIAKDEESGEGMSKEQLRYEALTLFIAGHETTALLLPGPFT